MKYRDQERSSFGRPLLKTSSGWRGQGVAHTTAPNEQAKEECLDLCLFSRTGPSVLITNTGLLSGDVLLVACCLIRGDGTKQLQIVNLFSSHFH